MWIDLLPTVAILAVVVWFIGQHRGLPVVQVHALIVASYLNVFPALDYVFSDGVGMAGFAGLQLLVIVFFQLPLMAVSHSWVARMRVNKVQWTAPARLSPVLPWLLIGLLLAFWFVALRYELFFRRLGHEGLQQNTAEVPGLLLYAYRGAVETAFFVIVFLWTTLRSVTRSSRHYPQYQWALAAYLITFILFFTANSRMQFVLLLLCLICTQPQISSVLLKRANLVRFGAALLVLVLGLTLFRELYLEENDRIDTDDLSAVLLAAGWLIAGRLDSVVILFRLNEAGFNPWGFDLSGVGHVLTFYISFFTDPATYAAIKESLVTSPSVFIVNRLLSASEFDFPKSMILDMFLSFGVLGLLITAALLGSILGGLQRQLVKFRRFSFAFLASLFVLPMFLEFEKEFLGFLFAVPKWTPALLMLYWFRPRFGQSQERHAPSLLSQARPAPTVTGTA